MDIDISKKVNFQRIRVDELKLLEDEKLYPPRFVIRVTGSSIAETSHVVFTFPLATQEIIKKSYQRYTVIIQIER